MKGMELWAIVPELVLGAGVLVLLPIGPFVPQRRRGVMTWLAVLILGIAAVATLRMAAWAPRAVFFDTYAVDPLATFFKFIALTATAFVAVACDEHFRGTPHHANIPSVLLLCCLGLIGLAASQDLVLIALFLQIITITSYILVAIAKDHRRATEAALKLFLFSAVASAVMVYGMTLLFGLTGTLRLPELAPKLAHSPVAATAAAVTLLLAGYGFKVTIVPFHAWAPDTYQGAPTPIAAFLSIGPKAAGLALLLRTVAVALPEVEWRAALAVLAAITMSFGNLAALRQTSAKRLLAYSSIAQAGTMLVGVATLGRDPLAVRGLLFYVAVYLFMNIGAFLSVAAVERAIGTDEIDAMKGLGREQIVAPLVLTISLLALAGLPPFGSFVAKAMLFAAAIGAHWTWLAVVMGINTTISLYYYLRIVEALYLREREPELAPMESPSMRWDLVTLGAVSVISGVMPGVLIAATDALVSIHAALLR